LQTGTFYELRTIFFPDPNTGYVVSDCGMIFKTTDAGQSWVELNCGTQNYISSLWFTDANTGYAAGMFGTILKTTNGGDVYIDEAKLLLLPFTVFPNPASSAITIDWSNAKPGNYSINIFDVSGKQLMQDYLPDQSSLTIDISRFPKGIYFVRLSSNEGTGVKKIVVL